MVFIRRRYYFWLFRAYLKKWKRSILLSILFGSLIFIGIFTLLQFQIIPKLEKRVYRIAYSGTYKTHTLPIEILKQLGTGLTAMNSDGKIEPALARSWDIKDNGKEYVFYLSQNVYFHTGEKLTAYNLPLEFAEVKKTALSEYVISYKLSNPYAPFLATVSRPILQKGLIGTGTYKLQHIDVDRETSFVKSLTIEQITNPSNKQIFTFYPSQEAAKTAFVLGEADAVVGVDNLTIISGKTLAEWKNTKVEKAVDYTKLVSIFYNTTDPILSNKKVRQALNYALPETFTFGERAISPIPPTSEYFSRSPNAGIYDKEIAQSLIVNSRLSEKDLVIQLSVQKAYEEVARIIQGHWKEIGVTTHIRIVDEKPITFQALIHPFVPPLDPDQYTLWHSNQRNNITGYKNVRIDKLLEDGRLTTNVSERSKIYADFQKYLLDDAPASFLYFPYRYTIRKF